MSRHDVQLLNRKFTPTEEQNSIEWGLPLGKGDYRRLRKEKYSSRIRPAFLANRVAAFNFEILGIMAGLRLPLCPTVRQLWRGYERERTEQLATWQSY